MHAHACMRACAYNMHTCVRWSRPFAIITFQDHTKIQSKMASFSVEAMVRGYHVYQDIWTAVVSEEFPCKREADNTFDLFVCGSDER